jgi:hypothetical protein
VSTPRRNSLSRRLHGLLGPPPADQPIQSDTGSLDPKSSKTSQFSVIRRFIGIESHASESYYHSYTVATSGANRLASQICHDRLFRKKFQQNILPMISTEVSSLAAHNMWRLLGVFVPRRSIWDSGATLHPSSSGEFMNPIPQTPEDLAFGREDLWAGCQEGIYKGVTTGEAESIRSTGERNLEFSPPTPGRRPSACGT